MRSSLVASVFLFALIFSAPTQLRSTSPSPSESLNQKRIEEKLHSIIIDKMNLDVVDLTRLLPYLTTRSKELDPEHIGVKFLLEGSYQPPPSNSIHREISQSFENVPLIEIVKYICRATDHDYRIKADAVVLFQTKKI